MRFGFVHSFSFGRRIRKHLLGSPLSCPASMQTVHQSFLLFSRLKALQGGTLSYFTSGLLMKSRCFCYSAPRRTPEPASEPKGAPATCRTVQLPKSRTKRKTKIEAVEVSSAKEAAKDIAAEGASETKVLRVVKRVTSRSEAKMTEPPLGPPPSFPVASKCGRRLPKSKKSSGAHGKKKNHDMAVLHQRSDAGEESKNKIEPSSSKGVTPSSKICTSVPLSTGDESGWSCKPLPSVDPASLKILPFVERGHSWRATLRQLRRIQRSNCPESPNTTAENSMQTADASSITKNAFRFPIPEKEESRIIRDPPRPRSHSPGAPEKTFSYSKGYANQGFKSGYSSNNAKTYKPNFYQQKYQSLAPFKKQSFPDSRNAYNRYPPRQSDSSS